jgi:hypothetical protein
MDPSMVPDADARASDAEREDTVERLRDAAGEGRLNLDELADRAGAAYSATTRSELALLVEDLPSITTRRATGRVSRSSRGPSTGSSAARSSAGRCGSAAASE